MDIWRIRGGNKLAGVCRVQGSKNASLPILAASILAPCESELQNVPQLRDIDAALCILRHLGCTAEQRDNEVYINAKGVSCCSIPHELMLEMRSSVIFMGALLARCGEARLSPPGGCQLGKRPIDLHLSAGCTILAAPAKMNAYDASEPFDFPEYQDGGHTYFHNSLIWAEGEKNVSITGHGMIDGKGLTHKDTGNSGNIQGGSIGTGDKAIALTEEGIDQVIRK